MSERRAAWLLVAVLLGQLVILSLQAPAEGAGNNLLESAVLRLVMPLARGVDAVSGGAAGIVEGFRSQRRLLGENRELHQEVETLQIELSRLRAVESELQQLAKALRYEVPPDHGLTVADVVLLDYSSWLRTLVIYTGDQPVEVNQPVVASSGLVGRVVSSSSPWARVQLLTDRSAAVGAMVERTRRQGVVRSGPDGLVLDFLPRNSDVGSGDLVVTSGIDGIYPRGIQVGMIASVEPGDELFDEIRLDPAVDFGHLDRVYLLARRELPGDDDPIGEPSSAAPPEGAAAADDNGGAA